VQRATARHLLVDAHFFGLLVSGSVWGRSPTHAVGPDGVKEIAVNRTATQRLLLGADPLGKDLHLARLGGPTYRVTGVAPDIRASVPGTGWEAIPAVYLSILAHPPARAGLLVRGMEDLEAVERAVLPVLRHTAPGVTFDQAESVWNAHHQAAAPLRWLGRTAAALAVGTLILSLLGIHAVIGDLVRRLRSEIGLRKAVGGTRRHILGMVGRRVARLTLGGLAFGTAIALSLGRLVQFVQHGVPMYDPLIHGVAMAMVAITVGLAAWQPAFHAADVPPAVALRSEGS
jgi:putative ABC transport system permease protein